MPTSRKRSEPRAQYCPCSRENIDLTQEHPLPERKHHRGVRHRSGTDGAGVAVTIVALHFFHEPRIFFLR